MEKIEKLHRELDAALECSEFTNPNVLKAKLRQLMRLVQEKAQEDSKHISLARFLQDEMSHCVDILKLRKLALCRLGRPGYENYRRVYFDRKDPR